MSGQDGEVKGLRMITILRGIHLIEKRVEQVSGNERYSFISPLTTLQRIYRLRMKTLESSSRVVREEHPAAATMK